MPRKEKTYHFIYKTTNLINGKYYIGMHSTNNLDDGYLGSGNRIRRSIKKYGKENFKIEILESFEDRFLLKEREKELVNENLLKDKMCLNLKTGGDGGLSGLNEKSLKKIRDGASKHQKEKWNDVEYRIKITKLSSNRLKKLHLDGKAYIHNWKGLKHKPETIEKMKNHIYQKGILNSQYGTMWITNGIDNKKIKKEFEIPQGWYKGRK